MTPERWREIKKLFQAVLEHQPIERTSFLLQACASDLSLQAEVQALIKAYEEAGDFIELPAVEAIEKLAIIDEQPHLASIIGEHIGQYKVIDEIGHGGMGTVYLAIRDDDQYQKQVAIKVVKSGLDVDFILRRFRTERQILASLDHPNVAKLLDGGSTKDGLPYFVMEYIEGKPIDQYCDDHKLPILERLKLFRAICSAIYYSHQHFIIHRDIKPSNILVTKDGVPKLLDFGIAKLLNPTLLSQPLDQTATMLRLMTLEYASPEQIRGEKINSATDIYSLGVLLYKLLCGHHPYRLDNCSTKEIERIICEKEPDNPSIAINHIEQITSSDATLTLTPELVSKNRDTQPEGLRHQIAGDLDNIVLMAMRKEQQRRYSSVEQFSDDILRHLNHLPVIARKDTFTYRTSKFIQRNRVVMTISSLAIVIIFLLGTMWITTFWRAKEQIRLAQYFGQEAKQMEGFLRYTYALPLHDTNREKKVVRAQMKDIEDEMNRMGSLSYGPGHYAMGYGYMALHEYEQAHDHLQKAWNAGYQGVEVRYALGLVMGELYKKALADIERIENKQILGDRKKEVEKKYLTPALFYLKTCTGNQTESPIYVEGLIAYYEKFYDDALNKSQQAFEQSPWLYDAKKLEGDIYTVYADNNLEKGNYEGAIKGYEEARKAYLIAMEMGRSDSMVYFGEGNRWLSIMKLENSRGNSPEKEFEATLSAFNKALLVDPLNSLSYINVGVAYHEFGKYEMNHGIDPRPSLDHSIENFQKSIQLNSNNYKAYGSLGVNYNFRAEYEMDHGIDPRPSLDHAIENFQKSIKLNPNNYKTYGNFSINYNLKAEYEMNHGMDPRPSLDHAIENFQKSIQLNPNDSAEYCGIAYQYYKKGKYEAACSINPDVSLNIAIENYNKAFKLDPSSVFTSGNIGAVYWVSGLYLLTKGVDPIPVLLKARQAFQKALQINPNFFVGYAQLSELEIVVARWSISQGRYPRVSFEIIESALKKSLTLNAQNAYVYKVMADFYLCQAEWKYKKGQQLEQEIQQGLELAEKSISINPEMAEAIAIKSALYMLQAKTTQIQTERQNLKDKTKTFLKKALEINPLLKHTYNQMLMEVEKL